MSSRDALPAWVLFAGFALVYGASACPTFFGGDSAELAAAAATLGVPHPPGYPTYTLTTALVGRAVAAAGLAGDFAGATALASAIYAAGALALFYRVLRALELPVGAALAAAVALGAGRTLWSQAVVTEVYTFDLLLGAAAALALVRATRTDGRALALLAGLLGGLWLGHRFVNVLYLPVGLALLPSGGALGALRRTWRPLLAGAAAAALVFLYLPLASARDPAIDIGDPSTLERFLVVVRGAPYLRHMTGGGWQLGRFFQGLPRELGPLVLLAPVGLVAAWRARRPLVLALLWALVAGLAFASRYRILDIEVYFLPALVALAAAAALGADFLLGKAKGRGAALATVLVAASATGLLVNREVCDLSWNDLARRSAEDLLGSVDEGAVVFVQGDSTIHGLWYLQAVERARPDVIVLSVGHLWPWYLEQLGARFPGEPWPPSGARGPLPPGHARALLDALEPVRPVYAALSVDTTGLIAPDASGRSYGTLPRGVAWRILPRGESVDAREWSAWNHDFLTRAVERLGELPELVDMDTKSTLLQYALALSQNAALLERFDPVGAREAYGLVLALDPDRHERDVAEDAWRGLSQRVPRMELGRRAREALERLGTG